MKVWLDDIREAPKGWVRTYCPDEVISLLRTGNVEELSLDHDLGDDDKGTGYHVLLWVEMKQNFDKNFRIPKIHIHSANVSARKKMELAIESIERRRN